MDKKKKSLLYIKIEAVTKAINELLNKHGLRFIVEHTIKIVPSKNEK